jgi:hypothetical protein
LSDIIFDGASVADFLFAFGELSATTSAASVLSFGEDFEEDFDVGFGTDFVPLSVFALFLTDADDFAAVCAIGFAAVFAEVLFAALSTVGVFDAALFVAVFAVVPDAFLADDGEAGVLGVADCAIAFVARALTGFTLAVFAFCSVLVEAVFCWVGFDLTGILTFFAAAGITGFSLRAGINDGKTTAPKPAKRLF